MKAYIRVTDEQGNEYEEELGELAIFTSYEEIDELIEFLKYVKKDHLEQHLQNGIEMTHNHFNMWKGTNAGKFDLQIWTAAHDYTKVKPALYVVARYFLAFDPDFSDDGNCFEIKSPFGKDAILVQHDEEEYTVCYSRHHVHLETAKQAEAYVCDIMAGRRTIIEFYKDGRLCMSADLSAQELCELSYASLSQRMGFGKNEFMPGELIDFADSFKIRGWAQDADFDATFIADVQGNVTVQKTT